MRSRGWRGIRRLRLDDGFHRNCQSLRRFPFEAEHRCRPAVIAPAAMERPMANDTTADVNRAWELMKKIGFAMLVTRDGSKLRARPMAAYVEREQNAIFFLSDARRHK